MPIFWISLEPTPDPGVRLISNLFTAAAVFIIFMLKGLTKQQHGDSNSILPPDDAIVMVLGCIDAIVRMKISPLFRRKNDVARATDVNSGFLIVMGVLEYTVYCILPEELRWTVYAPSAVFVCLYVFIGVKLEDMKNLEKEVEKTEDETQNRGGKCFEVFV